MKESTRIILNTLATYGRSLFALVVSLFSARWVLEALGRTDFGLYGVVGSLILLISFLNGGMSVGVARFYAYSVGRGQKLPPDEALIDLKRWFNTAFSIHLILPLLLVLVGYPIGTYAIVNWLTIPAERVDACLWVFRISLITGFVSVFSVPFIAMYTAHQYITELAFFNILRSCGTLLGAFFLLKVQSDRLIVYAMYMMAINAGIPIIQILRAGIKFKACRIKPAYMYCGTYLKELFAFVGWKMFGMSCVVMRMQGSPILINLFFGPQINAAYNIANRVSMQATELSTALMGAFQPAITSMEGRGDRKKVLSTVLQVCKFGTLLVLLFVIPLILEMDNVLKLWLKNPPEYSGALCRWMLVMLVIDRITSGQMLAVNAYGKIALYELIQGTLLFLALPISWLLFKLQFGPVALGYALVFSMALYCIGRLVFCKKLLKMNIFAWVRGVAMPIVVIIGISALAGFSIVHWAYAGFSRLCLTAAVTGVCTMSLAWVLLLNGSEKEFVRESMKKLITRIFSFRKPTSSKPST